MVGLFMSNFQQLSQLSRNVVNKSAFHKFSLRELRLASVPWKEMVNDCRISTFEGIIFFHTSHQQRSHTKGMVIQFTTVCVQKTSVPCFFNRVILLYKQFPERSGPLFERSLFFLLQLENFFITLPLAAPREWCSSFWNESDSFWTTCNSAFSQVDPSLRESTFCPI